MRPERRRSIRLAPALRDEWPTGFDSIGLRSSMFPEASGFWKSRKRKTLIRRLTVFAAFRHDYSLIAINDLLRPQNRSRQICASGNKDSICRRVSNAILLYSAG